MRLLTSVLSLIFVITNLSQSATNSLVQFSHRFRVETWDNAVILEEDAMASVCYTRQRTSVGFKYKSVGSFESAVKLTHEFRYYISPTITSFNRNEIVFDNLFIKWKIPAKQEVTFTLGRQNMTFGEGFLIMDPSPYDGSRTASFDAIRADYQLDQSTKMSVFYTEIHDVDRALPIINDQQMRLTEQSELCTGIYGEKQVGIYNIQGYYLYLEGEESSLHPARTTTTAGFRAEVKRSDGWMVTTENGFQFGKYNKHDSRSFGGYTRAGYKFNNYKPLEKITTGVLYLGGDNQDTRDLYEGWDPLFSRYPKWSESYLYSLALEVGVGRWTNMVSYFSQIVLLPSAVTRLNLEYQHITAVQPFTAHTLGTGKTRGDLLSARLDYTISKSIRGHLLAERFFPGNYYSKHADSYLWLRTELFYNFDIKFQE